MLAEKSYTPASVTELAPENENYYAYYLRNTAQFGEYNAFEQSGRNHLRSEFIADIEALAVYFVKELGLKRGDVYTIFMPTNAESLIAFMALNKLGIIVNFVHPLLPPENLKEIMTETGTSGIILLDSFAVKYAPVVIEQNIPVILCPVSTYAIEDKSKAVLKDEAVAAMDGKVQKLDAYHEIVTRYNGQTAQTVEKNEKDVALYINGGGTTGKSKTIMLSNHALVTLVHSMSERTSLVEEVGVESEICAMPFFHAFGLCTAGLGTIHKGTKAILLPKFDADQFIHYMKTEKVTQFNGVPNMIKKLLAHPEFDGPHLKNLKVIYSGGDDVRPALLDKFSEVSRKNGSDTVICQGYGLTECCAVCAYNAPWWNRRGSIGKPVAPLTIEVWDSENKPVKAGEIGQFAMSGETLMDGYLTPDRRKGEGLYTDENGKKWVLSGDLGYKDEDGYLYFVGRIKRVVVISGYNVYPGDIEKLLTEVDFIKESCAVQGYTDDGASIVRLYVVLNEESGVSEDECRKRVTELCQERLSKFCTPRDIRFIDALPRTRMDKVDFMKLTQLKPVLV